MNSKQEIEPGNTRMTEPEPSGEQEVFPWGGDEYLAGGIELHARIVEEAGKPGVDFSCEPTIRDREIPEGIAEYNQAIEEMCRETVANFPKIIKKARESSKNANNPVSDHIVDANKMVPQLFSPHGNTL